jgi:hypothetical protein
MIFPQKIPEEPKNLAAPIRPFLLPEKVRNKKLIPHPWLTGTRRRLQLWRGNQRSEVGRVSCRAVVKRRRVGGLPREMTATDALTKLKLLRSATDEKRHSLYLTG